MESLVAVELRNWVMRQSEAPLQSSEITTNQTVWALAGRIVGTGQVQEGCRHQHCAGLIWSTVRGAFPWLHDQT